MKPKSRHTPGSQSAPSTGSAHYVVTGYALVPHEVSIMVKADGPLEAMKLAKRMFERGPDRKQWVVGNSEDIASVFDFEPNSAMPPIGPNAVMSDGAKEK